MKKIFFAMTLLSVFFINSSANAQFSAQRDASHMIIVRVISEYKMNDQEYLRDIESLREDQRFNSRLERMLARVSNDKNRDSRNRQVVEILQRAGRDIETALGIR